ncbi:MAG: sulfite exporter TauE/SafE family protein [Gammaproteobacteria bacterium]|nr:MAG: sulfite exporter TauE/SafE family protein [Gammaproteobacteria bacterium]
MIELSTVALLWSAVAFFTAGTVKGVLGIGLPVVAIPLLAFVMPVPQAVALLPVAIVVSNIWQALHGGYFLPALRRFWPLILGLVVGTVAGAKLLASVDPRALYVVIGVIVMVFALTSFFSPRLRLPARGERWLGLAIGLASGVIGGMSTIYGPALIMFLIALRMPKDEFVGTIATFYVCAAVPLTLALGAFGVMGVGELIASALATLPLLAGMLCGQVLRARLNQEAFRKGLLAMLLLAGLAVIKRAVF